MTDPAPVKLVLRLDRDTLVKVLYIAGVDRPSVHQIRAAVKERLGTHGVRGCLRRYALAERDVAQMEALEPGERHRQIHDERLAWCREQVDRAFRHPRQRQRPDKSRSLMDVLTDEPAALAD